MTQYKNTGKKLSFLFEIKKKKKRDTVTISPVCKTFVISLSKSGFTSCSSNNNEFVRLKILCVKVIYEWLTQLTSA